MVLERREDGKETRSSHDISNRESHINYKIIKKPIQIATSTPIHPSNTKHTNTHLVVEISNHFTLWNLCREQPGNLVDGFGLHIRPALPFDEVHDVAGVFHGCHDSNLVVN